jgi:hypothetical protein
MVCRDENLSRFSRSEQRLEHPGRDRLERFMRGALSRSETRIVVRHLLTGCGSCREITGRLWRFGDRPAGFRRDPPRSILEEGSAAMTEVDAVQEQLRDIVRDFEALKFRLLGVLASVPVSPEETTVRLMDAELADPGAEIRTIIECVLHDSIDPAIGDLRSTMGRR